MAYSGGNVDRPNGFRPLRHAKGGVIRHSERTIADGYSTQITAGDAVKSTGTGKNIARCAATDRVRGVFVGCYYEQTDGTPVFSPYWPASQSVKSGSTPKAFVIDDPDVIFGIQADEDVVAGDIEALADMVVGNGDTSTGRSIFELDSSTITSGDVMKILGLVDGQAYGNFAEVEVLFSKHELRGATTGV